MILQFHPASFKFDDTHNLGQASSTMAMVSCCMLPSAARVAAVARWHDLGVEVVVSRVVLHEEDRIILGSTGAAEQRAAVALRCSSGMGGDDRVMTGG
eukprot:Skav215933  [mRNA]  locus=scaffold226:390543:390836:+ [translate_table: standard]